METIKTIAMAVICAVFFYAFAVVFLSLGSYAGATYETYADYESGVWYDSKGEITGYAVVEDDPIMMSGRVIEPHADYRD